MIKRYWFISQHLYQMRKLKQMIIDIHTHAFPEKIAFSALETLEGNAHIKAHTDGTMLGLMSSMDRAGIDLSVMVPVATDPSQVVKINDTSIRNNEKFFEGRDPHRRRIISFGCMHPDFEDFRTEIYRIYERGIRGIKIHPAYQGCDIDDTKFLDIIYYAASLDMVVLTHAGLDVGLPGVVHCSPEMCRNVWDRVGAFKFILAHMGGWENWEEVPEFFADTGVYLDTSFSSEEMDVLPDGYWSEEDRKMMDAKGYMDIIEALTPNRILFGSDSPWTDQEKSLAFIKKLPLSQEDIDRILYKNAEKLLGI